MGMRDEQAGAAVLNEDSRASARRALRLPARVTIYPPSGRATDTARYCHVLTQDISESGISIIYAKPLLVGQQIAVELSSGLKATVVSRVSCMPDGHYLIGCRFNDTKQPANGMVSES
jgi:hypothetical protein